MRFHCVLALSLAALTSCASIVSKSDWPVTFSSPEPGVAFTVKNDKGVAVAQGTTPTTLTLSASSGYFNGAEYVVEAGDQKIKLDSKMNGWYIGNIVFGGLIGLLIVDPATGAMWKLPENVSLASPGDAAKP